MEEVGHLEGREKYHTAVSLSISSTAGLNWWVLHLAVHPGATACRAFTASGLTIKWGDGSGTGTGGTTKLHPLDPDHHQQNPNIEQWMGVWQPKAMMPSVRHANSQAIQWLPTAKCKHKREHKAWRATKPARGAKFEPAVASDISEDTSEEHIEPEGGDVNKQDDEDDDCDDADMLDEQTKQDKAECELMDQMPFDDDGMDDFYDAFEDMPDDDDQDLNLDDSDKENQSHVNCWFI